MEPYAEILLLLLLLIIIVYSSAISNTYNIILSHCIVLYDNTLLHYKKADYSSVDRKCFADRTVGQFTPKVLYGSDVNKIKIL